MEIFFDYGTVAFDGTDIDIDALSREIRDCRNAINWANPTRAEWLPLLEDLYELLETTRNNLYDIELTLHQLKSEQFSLAQTKIRNCYDKGYFVERVREHIDEDPEYESLAASIDESNVDEAYETIIGYEGLFIDDAISGERDGIFLRNGRAGVYASCRSFDPSFIPYVEYSFDTGRFANHD